MRGTKWVGVVGLFLAVGIVEACVGDQPGDAADAGGSDASSTGNDGGGMGADGALGSDGSSTTDSGVDAGPPTFCQKQTAPAGAADYLCADFDGPKLDEGFLDASVTDGSTLGTSTLNAFSMPNGLAATVPNSNGDSELDARLFWAKGGTVVVSQMTMRARILPAEPSGSPMPTGYVNMMTMGTGNVYCELGYTRGGAVNGQDPYHGYFVHVNINGNNDNYYPVDALSTTAWTDVELTWIFSSAKSTVTLTYDGVSKLTQDTQFRGNNDLQFRAYLGPATFASTLGETFGFDDFEAWTVRSP